MQGMRGIEGLTRDETRRDTKQDIPLLPSFPREILTKVVDAGADFGFRRKHTDVNQQGFVLFMHECKEAKK